MTTQAEVENDIRYRLLGNAGFVGLIEHMGSDQTIEESARVSYGVGTRKTSETRGLLRYLMKHRHSSPFEQAELRFHMKIPIFVMRQHIRHRMSSTNEYSGRYSEMTEDVYLPDAWRMQSETNKQGSSDELVRGDYLSLQITESYNTAFDTYHALLERGVAKELARIVLPVGNYTELYWKIDLHNFFHYLKLRTDNHAQQEIRELANAMLDLAKPKFPICFEAWEDYVKNAVTISSKEMDLLKDTDAARETGLAESFSRLRFQIGSSEETRKKYGMSKREYVEFMERWINKA